MKTILTTRGSQGFRRDSGFDSGLEPFPTLGFFGVEFVRLQAVRLGQVAHLLGSGTMTPRG